MSFFHQSPQHAGLNLVQYDVHQVEDEEGRIALEYQSSGACVERGVQQMRRKREILRPQPYIANIAWSWRAGSRETFPLCEVLAVSPIGRIFPVISS